MLWNLPKCTTLNLWLDNKFVFPEYIYDEPRKRCDYDFVEIMACPSGCLNGGAQLR